MFMTKKKRTLLAYASLCSYIDDAAFRFNRAFLYKHQMSLLLIHSKALMIHYANIRFNVEDTVLEVYLLNSQESDDYKKTLATAYFEFKHYFADPESAQYYDSMILLDSISRFAENPMNRIYDVKYGQLVYALRSFLDELNMEWSNSINDMPVNEAVYHFFEFEESTIDEYIKKVLAAINS